MIFIILFLIFSLSFSTGISQENEKIVLMYHRIDEPKYPSTSISLDLFKSQMQYLKENGYIVDSISNIQNFSTNNDLKKKVYITFDDGFLSVYKKAYPILSNFQFPFSIFLSTKFIENDNKNDFMNWKIVKFLKKNNVGVYSHGHSHKSFLSMTQEELIMDILSSKDILSRELNEEGKIISFPYGETRRSVNNLISELGYDIGFGQHSGIINKENDFNNLPRFAINENLGNMKRFKKILNYSKLNISDVDPKDSTIKDPFVNFSFTSNMSLERINCFLENKILKKKIIEQKIYINLQKKLSDGRNRINCTFVDGRGKVYWYTKMLFYKRD